MSELTSLSNLTASMKRVISNGGSAGVDKMSTNDLQVWFSHHHKELIADLKTNSYRVNQIKGVKIPKPKGGYRQLGIPTVKDRLVQQAISQVLEQYYDPIFSRFSYGFRKGQGTDACLAQASAYVKPGYNYVVDIDLAKIRDDLCWKHKTTLVHSTCFWQCRLQRSIIQLKLRANFLSRPLEVPVL